MARFSREVIELAQESERRYGVPASVTLAQYALESGYGTSDLAKNKNNYFGVKNTTGGWKSYNSMAESFDAHGRLLAGKTYSSKTKGTTSANQYAKAIADTYSGGEPSYYSQLLSIMKTNNLYQYDGGNYSTNSTNFSTTTAADSSGGWFQEIGESILAGIIKAGAIILICVLAAVFFMTAFDLKIPTPGKAVESNG